MSSQKDRSARSFAPRDPALEGDPFTRVRYQYGMLLGAQDFHVEQREKSLRRRLHQALLHGAGTVLGLRVGAVHSETSTQLTVEPGWAIDVRGRDLYVDKKLCRPIDGLHKDALWDELARPEDTAAEEGATDKQPSPDVDEDSLREAYVVISYVACLSDAAPAIGAPCNRAEDNLAPTRINDSFRVDLVEDRPEPPMRLLAYADEQAADSPREMLLNAILDADGAAIQQLYSAGDEVPLLLARVVLGHSPDGQRTVIVDVDNHLRPLVPQVQHLSEHLLGHTLRTTDTRDAFKGRIAPVAVSDSEVQLQCEFTADVRQASLLSALTVHALAPGDSNWDEIEVQDADFDVSSDLRTVQVSLDASSWDDGTVVQVHLDGNGPTPLLDQRARPFAGMVGEPTPPAGRGQDGSLTFRWPLSDESGESQ